jgi:hypothetical protein
MMMMSQSRDSRISDSFFANFWSQATKKKLVRDSSSSSDTLRLLGVPLASTGGRNFGFRFPEQVRGNKVGSYTDCFRPFYSYSSSCYESVIRPNLVPFRKPENWPDQLAVEVAAAAALLNLASWPCHSAPSSPVACAISWDKPSYYSAQNSCKARFLSISPCHFASSASDHLWLITPLVLGYQVPSLGNKSQFQTPVYPLSFSSWDLLHVCRRHRATRPRKKGQSVNLLPRMLCLLRSKRLCWKMACPHFILWTGLVWLLSLHSLLPGSIWPHSAKDSKFRR